MKRRAHIYIEEKLWKRFKIKLIMEGKTVTKWVDESVKDFLGGKDN